MYEARAAHQYGHTSAVLPNTRPSTPPPGGHATGQVILAYVKPVPQPVSSQGPSATGAFTTLTPPSSQLTCRPARKPLSIERLYPALRTRRVRVVFFVHPAGTRMQNRRSIENMIREKVMYCRSVIVFRGTLVTTSQRVRTDRLTAGSILACTPCSAATSGRKVALKPAPRSSVNLMTIPCTPICPIQVNNTDMEKKEGRYGALLTAVPCIE